LAYWSISDLLTERWLSAADQGRIRDGIKAFDELIQYASIADSSACAIQLNAAKLSLALSDAETAKRYVSLAVARGTEAFIRKRIEFDPALSKLTPPASKA
jgi:hypothetical protein